MLIPIAAGTIDIDSAAKSAPLLNPIKRNATTVVCGRVPIIPPIFVPYRSAIIVIIITIKDVNIKGIMSCMRKFSIGWWIQFPYKIYAVFFIWRLFFIFSGYNKNSVLFRNDVTLFFIN